MQPAQTREPIKVPEPDDRAHHSITETTQTHTKTGAVVVGRLIARATWPRAWKVGHRRRTTRPAGWLARNRHTRADFDAVRWLRGPLTCAVVACAPTLHCLPLRVRSSARNDVRVRLSRSSSRHTVWSIYKSGAAYLTLHIQYAIKMARYMFGLVLQGEPMTIDSLIVWLLLLYNLLIVLPNIGCIYTYSIILQNTDND